ncbi:MAG: hypothetical protein AAB592_03085 [Patescibacteria group bacterium]
MLEKLFLSFLISTLGLTSTLTATIPTGPVKNPEFVAPVIQATSALVLDMSSQSILFEKNAHEKRQIGSISKLMTAMVILDGHALDEVVNVQKNPHEIPGSKAGLFLNEKLHVGEALEALLIPSGNDAAVALAMFDSVTEEEFVKKMNAKADLLGLSQTRFDSSAGLDSADGYSTAYDIMQMAKAALQYDFIRQTVGTKEKEIVSISGLFKHTLKTTNELLGNESYKFKGIKTGTTPGSGQSFVGLVELTNGVELITVILNSTDRFQETKTMVEWASQAYDWNIQE